MIFGTSARTEIRARILYGSLDTLSNDGLDGDDRYRVQLWRAEAIDPRVLKQRATQLRSEADPDLALLDPRSLGLIRWAGVMVDARAEFAGALTGLAGMRLQKVLYRSPRDPDSGESAVDPEDSEFSAELEEVELRFDSGRVAFVTWGQGRGWPGDCSLIVRAGTLGKPAGVYREAEASRVPLWRPHIGQPLAEVQVFGRDELHTWCASHFLRARCWLELVRPS